MLSTKNSRLFTVDICFLFYNRFLIHSLHVLSSLLCAGVVYHVIDAVISCSMLGRPPGLDGMTSLHTSPPESSTGACKRRANIYTHISVPAAVCLRIRVASKLTPHWSICRIRLSVVIS